MQRITIYDTDEYGESTRLGWFDLDAATHVLKEDDYWDGNNMHGMVSGMQINRASLYMTKGGRWVENSDHRPEFNGPDIWRFLTPDEAREWMIKSGGVDAEEALAEYFPETPDEEGPPSNPQGGRPAVGPTINVAYPSDLRSRIDAAAERSGLTRAAWLRQIAAAAVVESEQRADAGA